ncbi:MAG: transglycosylase SLT domain-containing protein [Deltaproteobacteria bacterium]|nr:transglycosylase SLT domain-containing protein [Deltaproteobacteria bacterium]
MRGAAHLVLFRFSAILFWGILTTQAACGSEPIRPTSEYIPSLLSTIRINGPIHFCSEPVPLHNRDVRERFEKEFMLMLWNRPQTILWLKRSSRYMPHIEKMLKKNGMPDDLKYLVIVESSLLSYAGSPKGAMGYWQFMEGTGKTYDLTIDDHIDERRNIFVSTDAAIRYLDTLHGMFGSWTLAASAYNMGEEGLKAEILIQKVNDYYQLYLPIETQRYIFRIISAKLIISNPGQYGFFLNNKDFYPLLTFDQVDITCSEDTPVQIIAEAADTYFKVIKELNPEIRGHYLVKGQHSIAVPEGAAESFHVKYEKLLRQWQEDSKKSIYTVKDGDSLSSIATSFNVPLPALLVWNRLDMARELFVGEKLIVYPNTSTQDPPFQE